MKSKIYFCIYVLSVIYLFLDNSSAADVEITSIVHSPYQYGFGGTCRISFTLLIKSKFLLYKNYFSSGSPLYFVEIIQFNEPIDINNQYIDLKYSLNPGNNTVDLKIMNLADVNKTSYNFILNQNYYCQIYTNDNLNLIRQGNPVLNTDSPIIFQSYYLNISKSMVSSNNLPIFKCDSSDPWFKCVILSIDPIDFISLEIYPLVKNNASRVSTIKIRLSISKVGTIPIANIFKDYEFPNIFPTNGNRSTQLVSSKYSPPSNTTFSLNLFNYITLVEVLSTYTNLDSYVTGEFEYSPFIEIKHRNVLGNDTHTTYKSFLQSSNIFTYRDYYCDTNCTIVSTVNYTILGYKSPTTDYLGVILSNDSNTNSYFFESSGDFSYLTNVDQMISTHSDPISFPFGYINNTNFGYTSIISTKSVGQISASFNNKQTNVYPLPNYVSSNNISVTIDNLIIKPTSGNSIFISVHARSEKGILLFLILPFMVYIDKSKLVSGNSYDGVYEFEFSYLMGSSYNQGVISIIFLFETNTVNSFESYNSYTKNLSIFPTAPKEIFTFEIRNITHFEFQYNNIDMSAGGDFYNVLWIGLDNIDPNTKIALGFNSIYDGVGDDVFYSKFDQLRNMYKIEFIMNKCYLGSQPYRIYHNNGYFSSVEIESIIGKNISLMVSKAYYDFLRPSLDALEKLPFSQPNVGWNLTISDYPNGFLNGTITILTDKDLEPYTFIINETMRIFGDKYNGVYQIIIPIDSTTCRSQTFMIVDLKLYDQYPITKLKSNIVDIPATVDVIGTKYEKNLNYSITCQDLNDNQPPKLESLIFTPSIDVGAKNRYFEAEFSISDDISGISKRHLPYIFIVSESRKSLKLQSTISNYTKSFASYSVKAELPYGFGQNNLIVSIYGIYDNNLNMKGYSTNDLKQAGLPYNINRTQSFIDLILERCSIVTKNGDVLSLYGHNLYPQKGLVYVDYRNGSGWIQHQTKFYTNSMVQINISPFISDYIQAKIIVDAINSNILDIYPKVVKENPLTPTPTITLRPTSNPNICPGTPACNGQGDCQPNGCKCKDPWYGPSCSSKLNPITTPPPAENPTTEFNVTNIEKPKEYFTSKIDLAFINELDPNGAVVNSYSFENWTLTSNTQDDFRTTYNYTSYFNGRQTKIKTTIEFFKKEIDISFAGGIINMHRYSIKFTIDIDKYDFVNQLHSMELVMGASISSSDSDVCSSTMIGEEDNKNVQWIKININDNALYCRFFDCAIVDDRNITIKNIIREDISEITDQTITTKVAIQIPYFEKSVVIDPDFSSLVDFNNEGADRNCKKKKGLSTGVIIAIAVSCSVVVVSLLIGVIIYSRKRYLFYRFFKFISKPSCLKREKQTINMSKMK